MYFASDSDIKMFLNNVILLIGCMSPITSKASFYHRNDVNEDNLLWGVIDYQYIDHSNDVHNRLIKN